MKNYRLLTLLFCSIFAVSSCSDDDDDQLSEREQMLMSGKKWQVTAATATTTILGVTRTSDLYTDSAPCEKDNLLEFRGNKVLIVDEGQTKCNSNDPQQKPSTWALDADTLTVNGSSFGFQNSDIDLVITQLTNSNLELRYSDKSIPGLTGQVSLRVK